MNIIPQPSSIKTIDEFFSITPLTTIIIPSNDNRNILFSATKLSEEAAAFLGFALKLSKAKICCESNYILFEHKDLIPEEGYEMFIDPNSIKIFYSTESGLFYGVQSLCQLIRQYRRHIQCGEIADRPKYKIRGFYHDVTRGKVPTLSTLKKIADAASFYKINHLQLYIEHTFAFKGHSEIWSVTDPLTADEIIALDAYCKERHIELVPSFATFGHLYEALGSYTFNHLCERDDSQEQPFSWIDRMTRHTLNTTLTESIDFVYDMLEQVIPLFSSDKFNICADETFDLGEFKTKELCAQVGKGRLYVDFLNKIIKGVKQYNKEVMFWGDIMLHYPELVKELPADIICLNWDYAPTPNEENVKKIADTGIRQCVCPGVCGWNRLMNNHTEAFKNITAMISYAQKYNAVGVLNTDWGDYGHINLLANSYPGLIYGAAFSWNPESDYTYEDINKIISHIHYGDRSGRLLDLLVRLSENHVLTFYPIVYWLQKNNTQPLSALKADHIYDKNLEIRHIREELLDYMGLVAEENRVDIEEFYVSSIGIELFNSLYLVLKKYVLKAPDIVLTDTPAELAVKLEYWLVDYKAVWLKRNKPSELHRLLSEYHRLCKYLRKLGAGCRS